MSTKKKPAAAKAATTKPAKKPAAPVAAVTLRVYPHVIQVDFDGTENPAHRILQPDPAKVEAAKSHYTKAGHPVSVEKYDENAKRLS